MRKTSIVTGGAGFLGRHVVQRLLSEGREVVVVDDQSTPGTSRPLPQGAQFVPANLAVQHPVVTWAQAVLGRDVEEVWHLASPASPPAYKQRRIETLRLGGEVLDHILSWATGRGARVLFASSSEVYGDPDYHPQVETDPARVHPTGPRSCYDLAKAYGEALCAAWSAERGTETRIARIFNTYGPGQSRRDERVVPSLIRAALEGTPFMLHGGGSQSRTFGYVDDTVDGLFRLMRTDRFRAAPVNVGGIAGLRIRELVDVVRSVVGPVETVDGPAQDEHDPRAREPSLYRLRGLGWEPTVTLEEGIRRTAEWMRANPD